MLIVSQDRENVFNLTDVDRIRVSKEFRKYSVCVGWLLALYNVGIYSTKDRAVEVLEKIITAYSKRDLVYVMPKE